MLSFLVKSSAQKIDSIKLSCNIISLPSPNYVNESYQLVNNKALYQFKKGTHKISFTPNKNETNTKKRKGRRINKNVILNSYKIIQEIISKDTTKILIVDSKIVTRLKEKFPEANKKIRPNFFLNFKEYETKLDSLCNDTTIFINLFWNKRFHPGRQIDGTWLSFYLKCNTKIVFDFVTGTRMIPTEAKDIKTWISIYKLIYSSKTFSKSNLKYYFNEENLEKVLIEYLEVMSK